MTGKLESISIRRSKDLDNETVYEAVLAENIGLAEHYKTGGDRQVSILTLESRTRMSVIDPPGLCFHKYAENILVSGIDLSDLAIGDRLTIGESELQVTDRKECFPACRLYTQHIICPLSDSGYFLKVLRGGVIRAGDPVEIL